jgi:hypothetical protein
MQSFVFKNPRDKILEFKGPMSPPIINSIGETSSLEFIEENKSPLHPLPQVEVFKNSFLSHSQHLSDP